MEELNKHFSVLLKEKGNVLEEEKSFIFIKEHINENNKDEVLKIIESNKDNINILSLFGEMKLTGFLIEHNIEEGLKILKECSDKKNSHAQYTLGQYYSNIFKGMTEALYYFKKSTENGHSIAPFRLSSIIYPGYGFRLDSSDSRYNEEKERKIKEEEEKLIKESMQYTIISAERGHVDAQFILGYDYMTGKNIEKDMKKALYWLMESHQNGNQFAKTSISNILKNNIEFYIKKCDENEALTKERNDLKKEIEDLKLLITHLETMPNGIEYEKAQKEFLELANQKPSTGYVSDLSTGPVFDLSTGPVFDLSTGPVFDLSTGPVFDLSTGPVFDLSTGPVFDLSNEDPLFNL